MRCNEKLDEDKSKHVSLAQQNGFALAFLQGHILSTARDAQERTEGDVGDVYRCPYVFLFLEHSHCNQVLCWLGICVDVQAFSPS